MMMSSFPLALASSKASGNICTDDCCIVAVPLGWGCPKVVGGRHGTDNCPHVIIRTVLDK
jgi:hypothetical protein